MDEKCSMELIGTHGVYRLFRYEKADGKTGYFLEEDGERVSSDEDGDDFYHWLGVVSGNWELFHALNARDELWADRAPLSK